MAPRYKNTRDKIGSIIRQWYYQHHRALTRVRLTHINGQKRDNLVEEFSFQARDEGAPALTDVELEVFAEQVESAAMDHGEAFPGLQSYKMSALVTGSENPVSNRTFKVSIYDEEAEDSATEPATDKGVIGQMMRLNESLHRSTLVGQLQLQRAYGEILERLSDRNSHLEQRQLETYSVLEQLLSKQQERDLALKEADARIEHRAEAIKVIKQIGPVLANRIAGGDKTKLLGSGNALAGLIRSFLEGLTDEQSAQMVDLLIGDQQATFVELIKRIETNEGANVTTGFQTWAMSLQPKQMGELNDVLTPTQRIQVSEIWRSMAPPTTAKSSSTH